MYLFELEFSSFLGMQPEVGLLDHTASLIFNFLAEPHAVLHRVCTIYIPTNSERGFVSLEQSVYSTVT